MFESNLMFECSRRPIWTIFGRTELIICPSKAKFRKEFVSEVPESVAPPKPKRPLNDQMKEQTNERTNEQTNEHTNRRTNERTSERPNERTGKRANRQMGKRTNESYKRKIFLLMIMILTILILLTAGRLKRQSMTTHINATTQTLQAPT